MAETVEIVQGWSGALPFICKADGVAVDLSGLTVTGIVHDRAGLDVSTTGKVSVTGTTSGEVTYTPGSTDLLASKSPYRFRAKVVDGSSAAVYFPNAGPAALFVHAE